MKSVILSLILASQVHPFTGTFQSSHQALTFLNDEKCLLTVPAGWDGTKKIKLKWRIKENTDNTVELYKAGFVKFTYLIVEKGLHTYLVEEDKLLQFQEDLKILANTEASENGKYPEDYLLANERVNARTLKQKKNQVQ